MNKQDQDTRNPSSAMPHSRAWLAVLVAGAALTLAACDKSDNRSAGEKLDSAVAKTEQAAETAAAKTGEAVKEAKAKVEASGTTAEMKEGMANVKEAAKECRRRGERDGGRRGHHCFGVGGAGEGPGPERDQDQRRHQGRRREPEGPGAHSRREGPRRGDCQGRAGRDLGGQSAGSEELIYVSACWMQSPGCPGFLLPA
jgi:hypothetical protein